MDVYFEKYGFYTVNIDYIKYLHSKDDQVFYNDTKDYERKPHVGILANLGRHSYCIPLTSAKTKQLNWKNITEHNYLIYEHVVGSELRSNDIYKHIGKRSGENLYKKLLGALEIKKMIPVGESLYSYIDFSKVLDVEYLSLLQKEYRFLAPYADAILEKAKTLYSKQKESNIIGNCYCNFTLLENSYSDYVKSITEVNTIKKGLSHKSPGKTRERR